ncbi:NAD-dependent protein deacetylase Sir2B [Babesia microti strain RI]|uniref:Regulatory protein SIR2 homolog 7 n=1 Tax=Babesia microti (strain RI) TaxID=1133968 RepID=A0A1R4ACD5_BABMR|nr:NAD-dependent protein deacetylase Sir2B [Babesia microti strain RI]SJK86679.1 NAD-dependent protein deacetylase Sir2B [Babesia microti strain RI]|eukprot:XP_021338808.1 NAD-dependent protein deacetylase Sir2B [Babesia microti strain RI]
MNSAFLYASRLSHKRDKGPLDKCQIFDPKSQVEHKINLLLQHLKTCNFAIVHSGAGVSTSSGISDFRGPCGIWTIEKNCGKKLQVDSDCTLRDNSLVVQYGKVFQKAVDIWLALPSKVHLIIAKLVTTGHIKHIITQNVDSLHNCRGLKFSQISELHGNLFVEACEVCGRRYLRAFVIPSISFMPSGHYCGLCSFPPVGICTDVVLDWFDSYDPLYEYQAIHYSKLADLHLCLGSSLAIQPACEYPSVEYYRRPDSNLYIVNYQKTSLDDEATQVIHEDVNYVITQLVSNNFNENSVNVSYGVRKRFKRAAAQKSALNMDMINKYGKTMKDIDLTVHKSHVKSETGTDVDIKNEDSRGVHGIEMKIKNECNEFPFDESEIYCDKSVYLTILRLPLNSPHDLYYMEYLPILKNKEQPDPIYPDMDWQFYPLSQSDIKENTLQIFLVKCASIVSIDGVSAQAVDSVRGLWKITINNDTAVTLNMWYNTSISFKLIYNDQSKGIEGNLFKCVIAYADGKQVPKVSLCTREVTLSTPLVNVIGYNMSFNGHIGDKDDKCLMGLIATLSCGEEDYSNLPEYESIKSFQLIYNAFTVVCKTLKVSGNNLTEPTSHSMSAQPLFRLILKNFSELNGNKPIQSIISVEDVSYLPVIRVNKDCLGELVVDGACNIFGNPLKVPPKKRRFTNVCFLKPASDGLSRFEQLTINYLYKHLHDASVKGVSDQLLGELIARIPLWTINYLTDILECR